MLLFFCISDQKSNLFFKSKIMENFEVIQSCLSPKGIINKEVDNHLEFLSEGWAFVIHYDFIFPLKYLILKGIWHP